MATAELQTRVHDEAGSAVIELTGDVDRDAEAALDAAYGQVESAGSVILDFSDVSYINSTGIAVIVGLLARARANRQALSARGLTEHYRQIFEITRLADFMTILDGGGEMTQGTLSAGVRPHRRLGRDPGHPGRHHLGVGGRARRGLRGGGGGRHPRRRPRLLRPRVHELGWDRPARDAARAREPRQAEAARVRADRALPPDLRADPARRGDRDLRRPRPRPSRPPAERGASDERRRNARRATGTGRSPSTRSRPARPPARANLVDGKQVVCPIQGFGKMWQKTYRVRLTGSSDAAGGDRDVEREFPTFWPKGNQFYPPLTGSSPGEVALLQARRPGGMKFRPASWSSTPTRSRSRS